MRISFHHTRLDNGLAVIGEVVPHARSVALGFFVHTGSRHEPEQWAGVSHFLEHMAFKGTERRTAWDINRDFDAIGAHYNAFTSEEMTVFHCAVLPEFMPQALDILADIVRPSLPAGEFELEKKVILEEIHMYADEPTWAAYEEAKQAFFAGHPLGRSVLGTVESVSALTREQMAEYHRQRYLAGNITLVAAGRLDWDRLVELAEKHCGHWPSGYVNDRLTVPVPKRSRRTLVRPQVAQEHIFLLSPGPGVDSPQRYAAELLALILGDDTGSRLYWALIDPGRADSADVSVHGYQGVGAFFTYVSCDPEHASANIEIALEVLATAGAEITEEELTQARNKMAARMVRAAELPMGRMRALGFNWTYLQEYRTVDDELRRLDQVTVADLQQLTEQYPLDRATVVALGCAEDLEGQKAVVSAELSS